MRRDPLRGLDIDDWSRRFRVTVSDDPDLERYVAVHKLTTYGRKHGFGDWDVHLHRAFEEFFDVLLVHETSENWLRREGWLYDESHDLAMEIERRLYGGTEYYRQFLRVLGER